MDVALFSLDCIFSNHPQPLEPMRPRFLEPHSLRDEKKALSQFILTLANNVSIIC